MDNNQNMDINQDQTGAEGQEKTFTQEDVNRIVQERLARERSRTAEDGGLDQKRAELDQRERRLNAVSKLRELGLPDYLADALNLSSDDAFTASMEAMTRMKNERGPEPRVIGVGDPIGDVGGMGSSSHDPLRRVFGLEE